jgi:hypothetical protein
MTFPPVPLGRVFWLKLILCLLLPLSYLVLVCSPHFQNPGSGQHPVGGPLTAVSGQKQQQPKQGSGGRSPTVSAQHPARSWLLSGALLWLADGGTCARTRNSLRSTCGVSCHWDRSSSVPLSGITMQRRTTTSAWGYCINQLSGAIDSGHLPLRTLLSSAREKASVLAPNTSTSFLFPSAMSSEVFFHEQSTTPIPGAKLFLK